MGNRIDKAFEGRWRFKGCKDGGMNLSMSIKELCKDFFEAGIAYARGDDILADPSGFDAFWNLYDKKVGKPKCEKLWARLSPDERKECMEYIPLYKDAQPDKQYRKNPETFLRNKSWHDEIITGNTKRTAEQQRQQRLDEAARIIAKYAEEDRGFM